MRVLIAGAGGMLAREVIDACGRAGHEVVALGHDRLDITDPASIDAALTSNRPDAVINCAAWSDVDGAEDDERGAGAVNDTGAALLAAGAARVGASVLYPSSDYVFDGSKGSPYLEDDMPAPLGAYGRTKLGGEVSVAAANPRHFIVRSSWLFGHGGKNFVETMLRIGDDAAGGPRRQRSARMPDQLLRPRRRDDGADRDRPLRHPSHRRRRRVHLVRLRPGDLRPGRTWTRA